MTIAEMIKKTRLDNNITQEEYAQKFGVTRQTVSSWENGKSMPDLQLIITICNTYNLSLDALLNEDQIYVKKIAITQKLVRILKKILPIFCVIVFFYLAFLGIWKINATKQNEKFISNVTDLGFSFENGLYVMYDKDTVYKLPNQKLPFMKFEFNLQQITATYRDEDFSCNILLSYDKSSYTFSIDYGIDKPIIGSITSDGTIKYKNYSENNTNILTEHKDTIENILQKMTLYYDKAYT